MKNIHKIICLLCCLFGFFLSFAYADHHESSIKQAAVIWANTLSECHPDKLAALYDKGAFLYATFSNMLDTPQGIRSYFTKLCKHKDLRVKFNLQHIRDYHGVAINSGLYTFSYRENNKTVTVPGRYTFVYLKTREGLMIIDHHSSVLPEN